MHDRSHPEARLRIQDESDLVVARRVVRQVGVGQGLPEAAIEALATAVTEVVRNIVLYAGSGELTIGVDLRRAAGGVVVTAQDDGPGIVNLSEAMRDGFSSRGTLGLGLPSARRLVDEFEIEATPGIGTTIIMRKWAHAEGHS